MIRRLGEVYSAGDVDVTLAGIQDVNPSAIEYNSSYAHEYQRGIKRKPRGWRMGAKSMDAKITLPLDIVAEIEKIAPGGEIARIRPFPIVITYFNSENEKITDLLRVKFTGDGRNVTPDGELEKELELFPLDMIFNVH